MKKGIILVLSALVIVSLMVWFSCNPFQKEDKASNLNVLDESNGTRLTITCTIAVSGSTWDGGGQTIICSGMGDGSQSADKLFQINDLCTITYSSISASGMSKMVRQNGGKTWKCTIYINGASLSGISEAVVRSDSTSTSVRWRSITANIAQSSWWYGNFSVGTY